MFDPYASPVGFVWKVYGFILLNSMPPEGLSRLRDEGGQHEHAPRGLDIRRGHQSPTHSAKLKAAINVPRRQPFMPLEGHPRAPRYQGKRPPTCVGRPSFSHPKEAIGGSLLGGSRWGCRSSAGSRWRAACVRRRHFLVMLPSTAFVPRVLGCLRSGGCGFVSGCGSIGASGPCGRRGHRVLSHCGY